MECPIEDKKISGCVIKYQEIDWGKFSDYLEKKRLLSKNEFEELKKYGWANTNRQ